MDPTVISHAELLGQVLQAISHLLDLQQRQGALQQEWLQRNCSLFTMPWMTKEDDLEAHIELFE